MFGYVYDEDKDPMKGVTVTITGSGYSGSKETDDAGYYEFRDLSADDYTITFEKEGYQTQTMMFPLGEGENKELETTMRLTEMPVATPTPTPTLPVEEKGVIFGVVNDEDDEFLKGVVVSIEGQGAFDSIKTDDDGYYEFRDLEAGEYALTYEKEGYQTQTTDVILKEGDSKEAETITMELIVKGAISGYVYSSGGDPIENVRLKLSGIKTRVKETTSSDADGFFEFTDLEADTYIIFSQKKDYKKRKTTVKLEEGAYEDIEITLRKTSRRGILVTEE